MAVLLLRLPLLVLSPEKDVKYGIYDNRQLVEHQNPDGSKTYIIQSGSGTDLFTLPLKKCEIDYRYRNGRLAFRDESSGNRGYIDSIGNITFLPAGANDIVQALHTDSSTIRQTDDATVLTQDIKTTHFKDANLKSMTDSHPFSREAKKVLNGNLEETDSLSRHRILSYCEHLRTAYTTKDIDFLKQVFSDNALIIVGHTIKRDESKNSGMAYGEKVRYHIRTKQAYLERISKIFEANKSINMVFSDFKILRHPTMKGIYGVTMRQKYSNDRYSDDGYLFLLWDFRNPSMPMIHVRTWQPEAGVKQGEELIDISDFNLD